MRRHCGCGFGKKKEFQVVGLGGFWERSYECRRFKKKKALTPVPVGLGPRDLASSQSTVHVYRYS
jgi:hypothetical protein